MQHFCLGSRILPLRAGTPGLWCYILLAICCAAASAGEDLPRQNGHKLAISLSYDDALSSHLDTVVPALNKYNIKASFYLTLASPVVRAHLPQWRTTAQQGHELGNHTLYHPCRASLPGREWVPDTADLDAYSLRQMVQEVELANSFLHAIDGRSERTFTPPCGDLQVKDASNYLPHIAEKFVAIKGFEAAEFGPSVVWAPVGLSAQEMIARIEQEAKQGTRLVSLIFHGVGGDYLSVCAEAHEQLLAYLAANKDRYSFGTYIDLMRAMQTQEQTKP
jgi:peptidoglycan/xylan/chitin deacetylase (PgdA/CDA1 family)